MPVEIAGNTTSSSSFTPSAICSGLSSGASGGQVGASARAMKYAANRPPKNITSEARKRMNPSIEFVMPCRSAVV